VGVRYCGPQVLHIGDVDKRNRRANLEQGGYVHPMIQTSAPFDWMPREGHAVHERELDGAINMMVRST